MYPRKLRNQVRINYSYLTELAEICKNANKKYGFET